jgi:serine/threonine-protein kinase
MAMLFAGRGDAPTGEHYEIADLVTSANGRVYEIGDRIAAGGNGVVHKCTNAATGEDFAVKFQLDLRADRLQRFTRERELLAGLSHDHLIIYEDHGQVVGERVRRTRRQQVEMPFLVMALARATLADIMRTEDVPQEVYSSQFRGLAHALGVLHTKAVHRDIKPENILVIGDRWVLSDYGLCDPHECPTEERITPDWMIVGPRFWMSPEANNRSVGRTDVINAASDVFQLASVFWLVVNRSHPTGVLERADWVGPEPLFDPVFRALHYNPQTRPTDGSVFAAQIEMAVLS